MASARSCRAESHFVIVEDRAGKQDAKWRKVSGVVAAEVGAVVVIEVAVFGIRALMDVFEEHRT